DLGQEFAEDEREGRLVRSHVDGGRAGAATGSAVDDVPDLDLIRVEADGGRAEAVEPVVGRGRAGARDAERQHERADEGQCILPHGSLLLSSVVVSEHRRLTTGGSSETATIDGPRASPSAPRPGHQLAMSEVYNYDRMCQ